MEKLDLPEDFNWTELEEMHENGNYEEMMEKLNFTALHE